MDIPRDLVLIVDDDQTIREMVCLSLSDEGYAVETAANGEDALRFLDRATQTGGRQPDVILLDMRMPIMDGWTFAAQYRRRPGRHAPIIVFTAAADAAYQADTIGAEAAVAKPFTLDDLLDAVARLVSCRRLVA